MANFGKRMVAEDLIKQIGQGGPEYTAGDNITITDGVISATDTTYTAGTGIDITSDVISANVKAGSGIVVDEDLTDDSLVVMVDQEFIPYKSEIKTIYRGNQFVLLPGDYNGDMDAWFADIPVLATNTFTDADTFGHPVINFSANEGDMNTIEYKGTYILRDTANNKNVLFTTYSGQYFLAEDTAEGKANNLQVVYGYRGGNNSYIVDGFRYKNQVEFRYLVEGTPTVYAQAVGVTRSNYFQTIIDPTAGYNNNIGVAGSGVMLRINKLKANYNAAVTVPDTPGTYKLNVRVDNNGEVDNISWVLEQ